jgi:hypothetical protein
MDKTRQADQQFLSELWHRFNAEWLPALTNLLLLLWEWLLANLIITAILSGLLLLGGCLIVRKATGEGWNARLIVGALVLFLLGLAGVAVVVHSI